MSQSLDNFLGQELEILRSYGWKKDKKDERDLVHNFSISKDIGTVTSVDLRSQCPPVYNQLALGSCTANAICGAYEFDQMKQGQQINQFAPSRLFLYYNERSLEGTVNADDGAQIRDGIKSINTTGLCSESSWPYDITRFAAKPSDACYAEALNHHSVAYKQVLQTEEQIKQCLISGYPIVFGITVYSSFESQAVAKTGIVPMPKLGDKILGGHAIMIVGFDDATRLFWVRNSWGAMWGIGGYCKMPYEYILSSSHASDFWTISSIINTNVIPSNVPIANSNDNPVVTPNTPIIHHNAPIIHHNAPIVSPSDESNTPVKPHIIIKPHIVHPNTHVIKK